VKCEVKLSNKICDNLNISILHETDITSVKASDHCLNDIIKTDTSIKND
jgi:hypothetical protein